jgi:hypothetical protein
MVFAPLGKRIGRLPQNHDLTSANSKYLRPDQGNRNDVVGRLAQDSANNYLGLDSRQYLKLTPKR